MISWLEMKTHHHLGRLSANTDERGAVLTEYAYLVGLIVIAGIVGLSLFGDAIYDLFASNNDRYASATEVPNP